MTSAILVVGILLVLIGWAFFWLNLHTPIQTRVPAVLLPVGIGAVFFALGRLSA